MADRIREQVVPLTFEFEGRSKTIEVTLGHLVASTIEWMLYQFGAMPRTRAEFVGQFELLLPDGQVVGPRMDTTLEMLGVQAGAHLVLRRKHEAEPPVDGRRIYRVTATIDGETHLARWTAAKIMQALSQWSDKNNPTYQRLKKLEVEPEAEKDESDDHC